MDKIWQIFDDEQGEIIICTDLKDTECGFEYTEICRTDYFEEEDFTNVMANFTEICEAHNSKIPKTDDGEAEG